MTWKIQLPGGEFLDTPAGFSLSFELNNQLFSSSNNSVLPGSFSFPVEVPLTNRMRRLLNHPDLVNYATRPRNIEGCLVYADGLPLFYGTLSIRQASPESVKVNLVANPMQRLKDVALNELNLGGEREIGNKTAMLAHAKATAQNPSEYDYCFFPIRNRDFFGEEPSPKARFQNFYNTTTQAFEVDNTTPAFMPFVRLDYVISRIFAGVDYAFSNSFQINDELKSIYLYNNFSMWANSLPTSIQLTDHVSKTKSTEFLRKVISTFNLGLFTNPWNRTIRLIPVSKILQREPRQDWTSFALADYNIEYENANAPEVICFEEQADTLFEYYGGKTKPAIDDSILMSELSTAPIGNYYIKDRNAYYSKGPTRTIFRYATLGCGPKEDGDPVFECKFVPLWDKSLYGEGAAPVQDAKYDLIAQAGIAGVTTYEVTPSGGGDPEEKSVSSEVPDRFTFYRGMQVDFDGNLFPQASASPYNRLSVKIGNYSAYMEGQYGIYNTFWKGWHQMLINGKHLTQSFVLPIALLVDFSFEDMVRVGSMNYMVKKLKIQKLLPGGKVLVEGSLISVI